MNGVYPSNCYNKDLVLKLMAVFSVGTLTLNLLSTSSSSACMLKPSGCLICLILNLFLRLPLKRHFSGEQYTSMQNSIYINPVYNLFSVFRKEFILHMKALKFMKIILASEFVSIIMILICTKSPSLLLLFFILASVPVWCGIVKLYIVCIFWICLIKINTQNNIETDDV